MWLGTGRSCKSSEILSGVRSEEAGAEDRACWKLEVQMRYDSNRKVLSGMRFSEAGGQRRLDLFLRSRK